MNGAVSSVTMRYGSISRVPATSYKLFQRFYSKTGSMEHPFFKMSKMEQFALCFSERRTSLANGAEIFPACVDDLNGMSKQLRLNSIDLSNKREVNKWLLNYRNKCMGMKPDLFVSIDNSKMAAHVYITKEKYPQLNEIVELFESDKLATSDPVILNSLIDYTLLNKHSGLFVENIYTFLLHNYTHSIDALNLIVSSIRLHLNSKLDYFPDIENIVSRILITVNELPENADIASFDPIFQDLLHGIASRFSLETTLSGFNSSILNQMLEYQLVKCQNTVQSKILFGLLLTRNVRPSDEIICLYLDLLNEKTKGFKPLETKLQKLTYLSDFRELIEHNPPIALIYFLIPLCDTLNELRNVVEIIKNLGDKKQQYFNDTLPFLLEQYKSVLNRDKSIYSPVEVANLYDAVKDANKGNFPEKFLKEIIVLLVSKGNFSKAAHIIDNHPSLNDSSSLNELSCYFCEGDTTEKKKFVKHYNISMREEDHKPTTI